LELVLVRVLGSSMDHFDFLVHLTVLVRSLLLEPEPELELELEVWAHDCFVTSCSDLDLETGEFECLG